jgi:hypothetical protein
LADRDVVRALAGFRAPPQWRAFGVVAPAQARRLDDARPPSRVTIAVLASRDGTTVSALDGLATPDEPGEGRLLDACLRVLDLPTAPPQHSTALWSALHWLDAVLATVLAADLGERPSWAELAALDVASAYATRPWRDARDACAVGRLGVPGIDPAAAEWMDDGMFSREAISAYPPMLEMLTDLDALLPAATFAPLLAAFGRRLGERLVTDSSTIPPSGW